MKSFREFLLEATMDLKTALTIFGLTVTPSSKQELNKLYKKLALDNHPDRGGSTEKMAQINAAKDILSKNLGKSVGTSGTGTSNPFAYGDGTSNYYSDEESERRFKEEQDAYRQLYPLMEKFDVKLYAKYFKEIFGVPFKFKYIWNPEFDINNPNNPSKDIEFFNKDRTVIITVSVWFSLKDSIERTKTTLGGNGIVPEYGYSSFAVTNGKKQIITKKTVKYGNIDFTNNPEVIFPRARMEKLASGSVRKNSAFKKRDFDTLLSVKYPIDGGRDYKGHIYGIENGRTLIVGFQRATIERKSFYRIMLFNRDVKDKFFSDMDSEQDTLEHANGGLNVPFMPENQTTYEFLDKVLERASKKNMGKAEFVKFYVDLHNSMFPKDYFE